MMEATRKRKRVSKNKKKAWRKTDIVDVEEHLEDQRLQERTGGLVSEKSNDKLFFVETKAAKQKQTPVSTKRRKRAPKPLKCHANLLPDPNTKPASRARPGPVRKKCLRVIELERKGFISKTQKNAEENRRKARMATMDRRRNRHPLKIARYDMWGGKDINVPDPELDSHYVEITKQKRVAARASLLEKPSGLDAVEVPHGGASYNPAFDDHQELLQKANEKEIRKLKAEKKLENQFKAFPTRDEAPTEKTWVQEMSAGLFDEEVRDGTEKMDEEKSLSTNPPIRREDKKTRQQRRKENERKTEEKLRKMEKVKRLKDNEFFRVKSIKKEISLQQQDFQQRARRKVELKEKFANKTATLGKLKFEEPDMELKLSDEIQGSLRLLKPEGNLAEDRFKSLQKRNIIEPRLRAKVVRKYKPKRFERK